MALTRQESGNQFLRSRGEGTTMQRSATWVAIIGLLLLVSAVSAMSQTPTTPGSDQSSGGVSTFPSLKVGMGFEPEEGNANADPSGRYDWKTSYDFGSAIPSHDSRTQSNWAVEASSLDMAPIEISTVPYLTVASKEFEHEFNSTYGNGSYAWDDLYEFKAKVAYAKSRMVAVHDSGIAVNAVDEISASDENYPIVERPRFNGAAERAGQDTTGLSMMNK